MMRLTAIDPRRLAFGCSLVLGGLLALLVPTATPVRLEDFVGANGAAGDQWYLTPEYLRPPLGPVASLRSNLGSISRQFPVNFGLLFGDKTIG